MVLGLSSPICKTEGAKDDQAKDLSALSLHDFMKSSPSYANSGHPWGQGPPFLQSPKV